MSSSCSSAVPVSAWRLVYRSFMMWPGPGCSSVRRARFQCTGCQPPVPEPEVDGGGVDDDLVAHVDGADEAGQDVGPLGLRAAAGGAQVDQHALEPGPLGQHLDDGPRVEGRHGRGLRGWR